MPRWTPRLVVLFVLPSLIAVPPLLAAGYVLARRALAEAESDVAGAAVLEAARSIAARLPAREDPASMEQWCRAEVHGSERRLTVVAADGTVLCDTEASPSRMANHLGRPEVVAALESGSGFDRRESATVHAPFLYAAAKAGTGGTARVVRVATPAYLLAGSEHRIDVILLAATLFAGLAALLPALHLARRMGSRLERIVDFSQAVAAGDLNARLPRGRRDEIGTLEENLNEMVERFRRSFRGMKDESEKTQGILRAMVEGVVVIARSGEVILINGRAENLFGLPEGADYRGRHLVEMCRDPELQDLLRETVAGTGHAPVREIVLSAPERRHLSVSVSPFGDIEGQPFGSVLVFHDITELKKLETMRRDFVANVSHELRTPLTAIRGYAETLLAGALSDATRARQFLAVIERHTERLSRLIDDLLTLSDLELGKASLKKEAVQFEALVDEVFEIVGEKALRGKVRLLKAIPPGLPLLLGDGDRLQQVLINLTDNAVKYTPAGGQVTIGARPTGNGTGPGVEVEVSDTGIGIPTEDLPRLTERFYRVDKARSRELGGTGLGLAIVKHIVQLHGGRLSISSEVNVGTTVRFSVPAWVSSES